MVLVQLQQIGAVPFLHLKVPVFLLKCELRAKK